MRGRRDTTRWLLALIASALLLAGCGADSGGAGADADDDGAGDTQGADVSDTRDGDGDTLISTDGAPDDTADGATDGPPDATDGATDTSPVGDDSDSDGLPDSVEGDVDTDNDGTPDRLDADSDGDGLPDSVEGVEDVDDDGVPNFRDDDSDGNGVLDVVEGDRDADGDGVPDALDPDNDGDSVDDSDEISGAAASSCPDFTGPGTPAQPHDHDGDGVDDYQDPDNDGDAIADRHEGTSDTDGDQCPDRFDLDADDDGLPDSAEAGDADAATSPVDTDLDTVADFRDDDSDADGLSDADEAALHGTDAASADSDDDGVSDLVEVIAGTDPTSAADNPQARGDFFFLVPYERAPSPELDTLTFGTNFQQADAYFLIDNSGSMDQEISAMRNAVVSIVGELTCDDSGQACSEDQDCSAAQTCGLSGTCIQSPSASGCIPSFWTGVGVYAGADAPEPITNLQSITSNANQTTSAIPTSADGGGAYEALFMAAECMAVKPAPGSGTSSLCEDTCPGGNSAWINDGWCDDGGPNSDYSVCPFGTDCADCGTRTSSFGRCDPSEVLSCSPSGIGCPGYRNDAARILVIITDEDNQDADASYTAAAAGAQLVSESISFIGIDAALSQTPSSVAGYNPDLVALANAVGSIDSAGQPFVRAGDATLVVDAVKDAINEIVNNVPIRVTIRASELPDDDGDALPFLDYLEVNLAGTANCEAISPVEETGVFPGHDDAFPSLLPGAQVCWDVVPVHNDFVPATDEPQVFQLELTVRGDGAILDQRTIYFLVPPEAAQIVF